MRKFYTVLINTLIANTTNNFLWFALVFWMYLETRSVIASSIIGAAFPLFSALSGIGFGSYVDSHLKKTSMLRSSQISFVLFSIAAAVFFFTPEQSFLNITSPFLWIFTLLVMAGAVAGNLRGIALSTIVTILVPEKQRDRANGLVGTVNGVSFAITSVFSGLAIGQLGMRGTILVTLFFTIAVLIHLNFVQIDETLDSHPDDEKPSQFDIKGAMAAINKIRGLWGLIFFAMINNLLGGAFFALMDPYGLELVSVETWGLIWGVLSSAFIIGGFLVAKFGLGKNPLRVMFMANVILWIVTIIFPLKAWIWLLAAGMFGYMLIIPFVEAAEQTLLQSIVPLKVQGRVFGFAQTLENFATPITALLVGPLAQIVFIPLMTDGAGAELIGEWFGTGTNRGIAVIFILAGLLGLIITLIAFNSRIYKTLLKTYRQSASVQ